MAYRLNTVRKIKAAIVVSTRTREIVESMLVEHIRYYGGTDEQYEEAVNQLLDQGKVRSTLIGIDVPGRPQLVRAGLTQASIDGPAFPNFLQ